MADILFSAFRGGKERKYCQDLWSRPLLPYLSSAFSHIFLFTLMNTPPSPPLLLVEKPLLWRMSWPLPIEVVGRWLLEGLWSQISASPPVYPGASAPPRISNFFLSKYWQPPVVLYNIEVERLLPQQSLLTLSFGAKCQSFFLCDSTFLLASYCPFSSVQLQVHWGPKHFLRTKITICWDNFFHAYLIFPHCCSVKQLPFWNLGFHCEELSKGQPECWLASRAPQITKRICPSAGVSCCKKWEQFWEMRRICGLASTVVRSTVWRQQGDTADSVVVTSDRGRERERRSLLLSVVGEKESRFALLGKSSPCNLSPLESAVSELLRLRHREWEVFSKRQDQDLDRA